MFNALNLLAMLECRSDVFWSRSSFVTLFYLVSPRRCNHPVVQRNNQQGPRLRLLDRMVAAFDMTWYDAIRFIVSIWRFFQGMLTDWLCLIVWEDAVDAVDGCQVTKAIEQAAGAVSGAFGGVACSHLFTFVIIEKTVCIPKLRPLDVKLLLTFDVAISLFHIRIYSDCF